MYCRKCSGRVFVDRVFSSSLRTELFCILCGRRWFIKNGSNGFSQWLKTREQKVALASVGPTSI